MLISLSIFSRIESNRHRPNTGPPKTQIVAFGIFWQRQIVAALPARNVRFGSSTGKPDTGYWDGGVEFEGTGGGVRFISIWKANRLAHGGASYGGGTAIRAKAQS